MDEQIMKRKLINMTTSKRKLDWMSFHIRSTQFYQKIRVSSYEERKKSLLFAKSTLHAYRPSASLFTYSDITSSVILFIHFFFRRHWVFLAARRLSLVAVRGGYSSLWCAGFSQWWLLLLRSTGSRCAGFSSCGMWAQ